MNNAPTHIRLIYIEMKENITALPDEVFINGIQSLNIQQKIYYTKLTGLLRRIINK